MSASSADRWGPDITAIELLLCFESHRTESFCHSLPAGIGPLLPHNENHDHAMSEHKQAGQEWVVQVNQENTDNHHHKDKSEGKEGEAGGQEQKQAPPPRGDKKKEGGDLTQAESRATGKCAAATYPLLYITRPAYILQVRVIS